MMNEQRWFKFELCEQMGHIGSEIARARIWEDRSDRQSRNRALERAFDLIDLTKDDVRLYKRRRELCYLRELLADRYIEASVYNVSLKDLEEYCMDFALIVNKYR